MYNFSDQKNNYTRKIFSSTVRYEEWVPILWNMHYPTIFLRGPHEAEMRLDYKESRAREMWVRVTVMKVRSGSRQ